MADPSLPCATQGGGQAPTGRPGLRKPSQNPQRAGLQRGLTDRLVHTPATGVRAAAAVPASPTPLFQFRYHMQVGPREGENAFERTACHVKIV